jgi:Leucine-rich repeat (LRR) protein
MACWSKFRVSTRIQNLGCFVAVIFVAFLLLSDGLVDMVEAITHAGDIQALKQVLMAVNAASIKPSSCLGSWNFSMDPCDARSSAHFTCGIDCSPATINGERYITGLQLERGAGYRGILSPHIGRLTALERLILSGNSFHGRIPASLANLKELVHLDLSVNSFSGSLPESLGLLQNIEFFSVAYNLLDGQIPKSLSNLTSIICMYLNNNQLSGNMPEFLELKQLKYLDASDNRLSGRLPAQLPPMLRLLSLGKNHLTGDLPLSLKSLRFLHVLDLRSNLLTGILESFIFELPSLQQLNLADNQFTSLGTTNASSIRSNLLTLDLSFNILQGSLPESIAGLRKLNVLSLQSNSFSGPIPHNLALKVGNLLPGTEQLRHLHLEDNYLTGDIPLPFFHLSTDTNSAHLGMNCLRSCPTSFFFCRGEAQRSATECQARNIPM